MAEERKKNYGKGSRHELIKLMLGLGMVTTTGLQILDGTTNKWKRMLCQLKKENLCASTTARRGCNATYLVNVIEKGQEYLAEMPIGYFKEYNEVGKLQYRKMQNRTGDMASMQKRERAMRTNEVQLMFYASAVPVLWDEKKPLSDFDTKSRKGAYYTGIELKRGNIARDDSEDSYGMSVRPGNLPASRYLGVYTTPQSIYPVYKIEDKILRYSDKVEAYGISFIKKKLYDVDTESDRIVDIKSEALLFYSSEKAVGRMMDPPFKKEDSQKKYLTVETPLYRKIFALPYSIDSQPLLHFMSEADWEDRIIRMTLPEGHCLKGKPTIPCDAIYDGCCELVFCVPEIIRLARFASIARTVAAPEKFRVYCYSWQERLVREVLDDGVAQIVTVNDSIERKYR